MTVMLVVHREGEGSIPERTALIFVIENPNRMLHSHLMWRVGKLLDVVTCK